MHISNIVKMRQDPLCAHYRHTPADAWIADHAKASSRVMTLSTARLSWEKASPRPSLSAFIAPSAVTTICPIRAISCAPRWPHAWTRRCA